MRFYFLLFSENGHLLVSLSCSVNSVNNRKAESVGFVSSAFLIGWNVVLHFPRWSHIRYLLTEANGKWGRKCRISLRVWWMWFLLYFAFEHMIDHVDPPLKGFLFFNLLWKWFILLKLMCKSSHSYENVDMNYVVFPTSIRAVIEFIPIDLKHCNPLRSLFSYVSMAKIRLWYGRTWANRVQNYRLTFMPHAEWLVYTINHISHSEVCIQRKYCKIDFENICLR